MADLLLIPKPISLLGPMMILIGVAGLAGWVSREAALLVVMVLLVVTAFVAGRMSRDLW